MTEKTMETDDLSDFHGRPQPGGAETDGVERSRGSRCVLLDQGEADRYAQWIFGALNPVTHLEAYERDVAIAFLCGAADLHVPADAAARFRTALCDAISARRIGCGSSCTRVSTTSTRRGTSGCTPPRSNGWRRAGRRADRTAAENRWDRINYLTSTARMRLPTTAT
jgi:hypothetical protein